MNTFHSEKRALLFDLDGTLIDTPLGFKTLLADLGWEIKAFDNMAHYYSGLNVQALLEHVLVDTTNIEEKVKTFTQTYYENIEKYTYFFPGVIEGMTFFKDNAITWGIISNKDHAQCVKLCQIFNLEPDFLLGSGVIEFTKPHPAPLLKAAQKLKVKPSHCYYIGDMPSDIQASEHALMNAIYCQYGCYHHLDPCYTYAKVCEKFDDIYHVCNISRTTNNTGAVL